MKQSRAMSLVESIANVAIGYGVAVLSQMLVFPLFGISASLRDNLLIGLVFTAISIARSFMLRRIFEAIRVSRQHSNSVTDGRSHPRVALVNHLETLAHGKTRSQHAGTSE